MVSEVGTTTEFQAGACSELDVPQDTSILVRATEATVVIIFFIEIILQSHRHFLLAP